MKRFLAILLSSLLIACATTNSTDTPQVAAQKAVFQMKSNYDVALAVAVAYRNLPRCGLATSPVLCSQVKIVLQLQQADDLAFPALQAAENTVRNPCPVVTTPPCDPSSKLQIALTAANQAIAALTSITATLQTK